MKNYQAQKLDNIVEFIVTEHETPQLLAFLITKLPSHKRTTLKQMLSHRQVRINGNVTTQATKALEPGDKVEVNLTREFIEFYHRRLRIVHEDDDIIVVNKGYGLLSMADDTARKQETAYSILRDYQKKNHPGNKLFIVHRLDRDTSGLMLFAKTIEAKEALQYNWNNMVLERKYLCVVEGTPEPQEGTVRSYLLENSKHEVYSMADDSKGGKLAVTRYRTLGAKNGYSLVECELDTGRKNQIRVQLASIGHPIAGDKRYGAQSNPLGRLCLHAQVISFIHPVTREVMKFDTDIPAIFR
jgi:23S rRNA pseudouridine1911/1915/1917 synthase